ncbi:MAG: polysaccharide deacetylase family protein [Bacteroidota bacterium]
MKRRTFVQQLGMSALALGTGTLRLDNPLGRRPSHLVTFSFDDGFKKSFLEAARIHEQHGLSGCFNVIASAHLPEFVEPDDYIKKHLMGDFDTWNSLQDRGHEVMVHSWAHNNLARLPEERAKKLIDKSLDYFEKHLDGFKRKDAIFNFPFNASTPALEDHTLAQVRAIRTGGNWDVNPFPTAETRRLSCVIYPRPGNGDAWVENHVNTFLENEQGGWLIVNTHGLGDEGWGPISAAYLDKLLGRLVKLAQVEVLNVTQVLDKYA